MARRRAAGGRLQLCAGAQRRPGGGTAQGFTGVLQTDGYTAYSKLADAGRRPAEAGMLGPLAAAVLRPADRRPPIAAEALERIAALYRIEAESAAPAPTTAAWRGSRRPAARRGAQSLARENAGAVSSRSTLAQVIRYGSADGTGSPCSSTTAVSKSTPIPSSAPCAPLRRGVIVPPFTKYLGTLEACRRQRRDTGDLSGPPPF